MKNKILKNLFFLNYIIFILTISLSCSNYSLSSKNKSQTKNYNTKTTVDTNENEVDYPYTKYKSLVQMNHNNRCKNCKFTENTSIDINNKKIKTTTKYNDDISGSGDGYKKIEKSLKDNPTSSTSYTKAVVSKSSGSEYKKIYSLFLFVSDAETSDRTVTFDKPVPFLPRTDNPSQFLTNLEDNINFSYVYTDTKNKNTNDNKISITTTISATEDEKDDDIIIIRLTNTVNTVFTNKNNNPSFVDDFWMYAVFPKTSIYHLSKRDKKIKYIQYTSRVVLSDDDRTKKNSGYYTNSKTTDQNTNTYLCSYKTKENTESFDCEKEVEKEKK